MERVDGRVKRGARNYRASFFNATGLSGRSFIPPYKGNRGQRENWPSKTSGDTFGITDQHKDR